MIGLLRERDVGHLLALHVLAVPPDFKPRAWILQTTSVQVSEACQPGQSSARHTDNLALPREIRRIAYERIFEGGD
jgi:hypothetical protein